METTFTLTLVVNYGSAFLMKYSTSKARQSQKEMEIEGA